VVYKAGSHRVMGLLAMSRALGDHFLRPYVIPEPEVRMTHNDSLMRMRMTQLSSKALHCGLWY